MSARTRSIITVVASAAATALFIATPGAIATNGDIACYGCHGTATYSTLFANTTKVSLSACQAVNPAYTDGLVGCGYNGVIGLGNGGAGVYGTNISNAPGVYGVSQSGTALRGDSTSGTALQVNGKAKFSRSGTTLVAAGTASKTISLAGVTSSSMVIATAQQNGVVFVKAAVPASGSFTIFLTGSAPGSGLKVAYFVLN